MDVRDLDRHEAKVCFKLYRQGCFGKGRKLVDTVTSGFPSHELGAVKHAIEHLIADNILVEHPTRHGRAVHIHPDLKSDVYQGLRKRPEYRWMPR
jgi:hypothetical protein